MFLRGIFSMRRTTVCVNFIWSTIWRLALIIKSI